MMLCHRCECGHPDIFHKRRQAECSHGTCKQKCKRFRSVDPTEPKLLPTFIWDGAGCVLDETLKLPGSKLGSFTDAATLCACEYCFRIYGTYGDDDREEVGEAV